MPNIVIGVPIPQNVPSDFVRNLIDLISYSKRIPDIEIHYLDREGVSTAKNRNFILQKAIELKADYILWLDADMLYPHDMIEKYLAQSFDIIGCEYFKRAYPYHPVAYVSGNNPLKPYVTINPLVMPKDTIVEVDGLGYGGLMVSMKVYEAMGDKKWTHYGTNFHLPFESEDSLTHDLQFCKEAKEFGFKIYMHTGVKPGHIANYVVTQADWERVRAEEDAKEPKITVIMPTIHPEKAKKTAKILTSRAGIPHTMLVVEDVKKSGFVAICNGVVEQNQADYFVYVSDDVFPSRDWLKDAYSIAKDNNAGLVGFNDGKWDGAIATSGLVEDAWMRKNYNGKMFFPDYFGHYNDTELTILAINDNKYFYSSKSCLMEVDYDKESKAVNTKDRDLFTKRKSSGFDGKVSNINLINNYA